jgi:hypothetical protein
MNFTRPMEGGFRTHRVACKSQLIGSSYGKRRWSYQPFIAIGTAVQAVPKQDILVRKIPTDGQVPDLQIRLTNFGVIRISSRDKSILPEIISGPNRILSFVVFI